MTKQYMNQTAVKSITSASIPSAKDILASMGFKEDHGIWESPEYYEVFFKPFEDSTNFYYEN